MDTLRSSVHAESEMTRGGNPMSGADSMVTLQERLVNLVNQLNMPILETSLVVSRWTNRLLSQLQDHTSELPENLAKPWKSL